MALSRFWHTRGDLSEGRAALRRALEAPVAAVTRGLATALTWESALAHHQGDLDEAVALGERAVAASRVVGDPLILGMALVTFGDNLTRPGDLDRAVAALDEGVAILRAAGDCVGASLGIGIGIGIGLGLALLGAALRLRGDLDGAAAALEATVREHQVAALVARGLTNPQIAEQLVISRRTADRHVSNILDKLGLATRAAVAAWTVEEAGAAARD